MPRDSKNKALDETLFSARVAAFRKASSGKECTCSERGALRTVVILSFENRYAMAGGLGTVMEYLPGALQDAGERVIMITPFHERLSSMRQAHRRGAFSCRFHRLQMSAGTGALPVSCFEEKQSLIPTYYIAIDGCFQGEQSPYACTDSGALVRDSLSFCAAIPFVCAQLGITDRILFHLHDWETAAAALSVQNAERDGILRQARPVLTLHNSFDAFVGRQAYRDYLGIDQGDTTIIRAVLDRCTLPVTTVSSCFSVELTNDPLQTGVFAPHLQEALRRSLPIGIENGIFGSAEPAESIVRRGRTKDVMRNQKAALRSELLRRMTNHRSGECVGRFRGGSGPVFFLSGRMDLGQKGFDLAFRAFERLPRNCAKLLFSPSPGSVASGDRQWQHALEYFERFTSRCKGDIEIWPFRLPYEQYRVFLEGSDFLVMPSFYEPFGAATEGMLSGTPVIARATGGLIQQVAPLQSPHLPLYYPSAIQDLWSATGPSGLLFREQQHAGDKAEWNAIISADLAGRTGIPLYERMVTEFEKAFRAAISVYANPETYFGLIHAGYTRAGLFDWVKASGRYRNVFDLVLK